MKNRILAIFIILAILMNSFIFFIPTNQVYAVTYSQVILDANEDNNNGIDLFPESYKKILKNLIDATGHTNWKFKPFYTDIDWNELTSSENENKCLRNAIYKSNGAWLCTCGKQGDAGYYCASSKIVNYYLDPRNFLTETTIFQFLDLSSNDNISIEDIEKAVKGTYLEGQVNGKTYAQMIYEAAEISGESALSIVVKIFQELGKGKDLPGMISGKNSSYPETYNFFNYGMSDGAGNIKRGLEYAKNAGWSTPEIALKEGAKLIANSYTKAGQNTKYTFKFDVVSDSQTGLYWHQYMTNIQDPTNQAKMLYDEYLNNNWLNQKLTFVIPIYKNMPSYVKLPTNLSIEDGELYYISSNYGDVVLRIDTNSSSDLIETLKRDTVVLMKNYNFQKTGWSKVSVNGKEGFISNAYLAKVNLKQDKYKVPNQTKVSKEKQETKEKANEDETNNVNDEKVKISGNNIIIMPSVTLKDLKQVYTIQSISKDEIKFDDNTNLATGTIVKIDNKNYTIVKLGDINGDGFTDTGDSLMAKLVVLGNKEISGAYKTAMDVNKDSYIDTGDTLILKKVILGIQNLEI